MTRLNLPDYTFRIRKHETKLQIFDVVRKKFVALTPEEWVRQNIVMYLIEEKKYPHTLFSIESELRYNRLKKRSDITVFDKNGHTWMLIECKAPEIPVTQKVFNQVAMYNASKKTKAKYLAVTNGLRHFCCELNYSANTYNFLNEFPVF